MKNNPHLIKVVKNINKGYISLKKRAIKQSFISYSIKIKINNKSKNTLSNEISIKDILTAMLNRTNKIYDAFQFNLINIKLDNDEYSKRAKIIKNIKDFISKNIIFKNNNITPENIFCDVIYFFDLLIIKNKKHKLLPTLEKLGLGALILVIKFNKLEEKVMIKKYKSIFNDKYMTLEEINKIEILSLKLIDYYIAQPNPMYYLNFLYKNIFINNKYENLNNLSKMNIVFLKTIMSFSNNYVKYHPFYLSCFIIKFCFEQYKIDGFQKTLIDSFDINMRIFRNTYEEFVKNNDKQMKIAFALEKQKREQNKTVNKINIIQKMENFEKFKSSNISSFANFNPNTIYKSCKKEKKPKFNDKINFFIRTKINHMNNTYYKKFLDNYLSENRKEISESNFSLNKNTVLPEAMHHIIKKRNKKDDKLIFKKMNYTIESPKKCGILLNYRNKKKIPIPERITLLNSRNNLFNTIKNISEDKNEDKNEYKNEENNDNNENKIGIEENEENKENIETTNRDYKKRINSELSNSSYRENCCSIRKIYKNKNTKYLKDNNNNEYLINEKTNNEINQNIIKNNENTKKKKKTNNIKTYFEKNNNFNSFLGKDNIIDDSNLKSTINQSESSFSNYKDKNIDFKKRVRKVHIRNFYKQKNAILFNFSNYEK